MAKAKKDTSKADADAASAAAKSSKAPAKQPAAAAESPAAPKAAAAKKPAAKASKPAGAPTSAPLIDTDLAASAAAAMVGSRNVRGAGGPAGAGGQGKESSAFRHLKESLNKPGGQSLGGILGTGPSQQKKSQAHGPDKQVGRNQTFGADVNRTGVPRRTGGG